MKIITRQSVAAMTTLVALVTIVVMPGCEQGKDPQAQAALAGLKQQLAEAHEQTEVALRQNALLHSRLKTLERRPQTAVDAAAGAADDSQAPDAAVKADAEQATTAIKAELATAQAALKASDEQLAVAQARVVALEAAEKARETKSAEKAADQDDANAEQAALQARLQALADDNQALEQRLTDQDAKALTSRQQQAQALQAAEQTIAELRTAAGTGSDDAQRAVSREASLKEQLVAVQADKEVLENRLAEQQKVLAAMQQQKLKSDGRAAALEQSLSAARVHGNSLAEQLAAIQADTQGLEERLMAQSQQLQAHEAQAQAATETATAATTADEQAINACQAEEARLRDRAGSAEDQLGQAEQRAQDLQQQLQGAVAQTKALQQQVLELKAQRDDREKELVAMETDCEHYRHQAARALQSELIQGDAGSHHGGTHMSAGQALELQTLLEESQALLEACNASLGAGAHEMFDLEQRYLGMQNAMDRQRRVAASRCRAGSRKLQQQRAENSRLRALLPPPPRPLLPPPH